MILDLSPSPRTVREANVWESNFRLLVQFRDREGHLRVPARHVEDGQKLGNWIRKLRAKQITGKLVPEKERRLQEIGFVWKGHDEKWDIMFRALTQFKQREGHCNVPNKHIEILNGAVKLKLGYWLQYQRFPKGGGNLPAKKAERLERLGVSLIPSLRSHLGRKQQVLESMGAPLEDPQISLLWDFNFLLLLRFRDREGHMRVPQLHVEEGQQLGNWIDSQRKEQNKGKLLPERERRLNEIGCIWAAGHWDTMFRALTQFKRREGHCNVSDDHIEYLDSEVEDKLGNWLLSQRLYQERVTLKAEREGHVSVPYKHGQSAARNLGAWLAAQLTLHRHGLLELDRQKWLEVALDGSAPQLSTYSGQSACKIISSTTVSSS
jgi:hypothetical protein